jgi:Cdc6-like AAA superfamily ATPase
MPKAERDMNLLAPHVFGLVKDAFVAMQQDGVPQSVVITGETGSGKTATFKIALQYLLDTSKAQRATRGRAAAGPGAGPGAVAGAGAGASSARGKTAMSAGACVVVSVPGALPTGIVVLYVAARTLFRDR